MTLPSFFDFNIGHLFDAGMLLIAYLGYRSDRRKEIDRQEKLRTLEQARQESMHRANSNKLEELVRAKEDEKEANENRDHQLEQLSRQTGLLQQMVDISSKRIDRQERLIDGLRDGS